MRIDLNAAAVNQLAPEAAPPKSSHVNSSQDLAQLATARAFAQTSAKPTSGAQGEDTATLSSTSLIASSLTATALQLAPVRQAKVDAISQAIHSGQYEVNSSKIADAIVSDRVG